MGRDFAVIKFKTGVSRRAAATGAPLYDMPPVHGSPSRKMTAAEAVPAWQNWGLSQQTRANNLHEELLGVTHAYQQRAAENNITFDVPNLTFETPETEVIASLDKMSESDEILRKSREKFRSRRT